MKYTFPHITHIDQVRPVIENVDGFIIAEREWGFVANYIQMGEELFPPVHSAGGSAKMREARMIEKAIRRECRGLIFDRSGNLISRPFHKFFNVNEREETLVNKIDLDAPHVILEKLDGSMIRPIPFDNGFRLGTKMGITDISMQAEVFVSKNPHYAQFIMTMLEAGLTPIFEWCSRQQRIVIDYPVDRLVLTAVRHLHSGVYMQYDNLCVLADQHNIDVVKTYAGTVESMQSLMDETRDLKGQEGWIIRWADGHMAKIKAAEYLSIHKAKDNILRERGVLELILDEKLDDVKPFLIDEDRQRLIDYENSFWAGLRRTADEWTMSNNAFRNQYQNDRKSFALEMAPKIDSHLRSAVFTAWDKDNFNMVDHLVNVVRKNIGTQPKINDIRHLWGSKVWSFSGASEE